jgi:cardiolipin synthase
VSKIAESAPFVDNEGITSSRVSVTKELITYWEWIGGAIHLAVAGLASGHVVLKKRDSRSAVGWVGLIWLTPFVGAIIYSLVGINRIQRRARAIRREYANLRNHRKILVVDSGIAFTGGMNIRGGHDLTLLSKRPVQDLHFRLEGPAVAQVQDVFAKDWEFCTSESLQGDQWFPLLASQGSMQVRGITSGPDDDTENLRLIFLGALACARTTVSIVTPYFLPDPALISALNIAALRGVQVNIFVPTRSNLRLVQWASTAQLWQVLEHGCKVWLTPPPFDHAKLIVVDGIWTLFGSANWDPRSLRLNFEFNLESYDRDLAAQLEEFVGQKLRQSRCISLADVDSRTLLIKLRDGVARLFTPYL